MSARDEAAGLIRIHFWTPRAPGPTRDGRAWTMARELDVWRQLARHTDPEELNGAITKVRQLTGSTGPIRLTWFVRRGRGPALLARAVAAWHASHTPCLKGAKRGGGFVRLSVELPPPSTEAAP